MNFTKSIVTFGLASIVLLSCKNATSKPALGTSSEATSISKKESSVVAKPETASFKIDGMTCAIGCAKTIETKLAKMGGVQKATVDFDKKKATVVFDAAVLTPEKITKAVESTGDGETYKVSEMKSKEKV
ncbi:heavy metal-associated domain-containing protein [Flavobacterium sp.]|uniref:heavy-metal-associated domain-containing protein n=1 Tax=Flavobacterium sp. TaxID=239 RepID=UPI0025E00480|nr:heavy metal-associated domain-containing protein [Flavobacterium sp.]